MPGFRSILIHLDATPASLARLAFASVLAERYAASITALFGVRPAARDASFSYSAGAALHAAEQDGMPHGVERARLREILAGRHGECTWCEVVGDSVRHGFVAEALYADLLVLGPPSGAEDDGAAPAGFVETVMLESGTPTIVVPDPHRHATVGERVVIAWNGSAPAARALRAALPMLRDASSIHVATWGPPPVAPFSRLDVVAWLRRHGVEAEAHARDSAVQVARELASLAADVRADLVVMGCYGHSRMREQFFGGVTRSSLANLPMPILMAH